MFSEVPHMPLHDMYAPTCPYVPYLPRSTRGMCACMALGVRVCTYMPTHGGTYAMGVLCAMWRPG